jgi:hypothetical protein
MPIIKQSIRMKEALQPQMPPSLELPKVEKAWIMSRMLKAKL